MKKFLLGIGVACIAMSSWGATSQRLSDLGDLSMIGSKAKELRKGGMAKAPGALQKIAPGLESMTDVITSAEGETVDVTVTCSGITMSGFGFTEYQDQMMASHIVYGADNEVYIYEIFPYLPTQSYFKGVKDGDKITVEFPQAIYYDDSLGFTEAYYLTLLSYSSEYDWYYSEEKSTLTFNIDEFGTMTAEGLSKDMMLGVADSEDGSWIGLGAWALSISTFDEEPVKLPEGYEVSEAFWTAVGNGYGWQVNFAQGGEEIYFQGLSERMPDAWVKGTVEYNDYTATISIAQNQYVGDYRGYHIFTKCVQMTTDKNGNIFYDDLTDPDYEYQLIWDFEEETMTVKDKDIVLLFNTSLSEVLFVNDLMDLELIHQETFEGKPANPYGLAFEDVMLEEGFSMFSFSLPAISTEGDYLKLDNLSYVVYVDGEEWTFDAEEYELEESLEELPWNLNNYWIIKGFDSTEHLVAFFVEGIETLGVQSVYRYNGEETRSEIVTLDLDENSVEGIDAEKKIVSEKYYDVAGRQVANPGAGIVIKRITYEDGTVASFKKAVR